MSTKQKTREITFPLTYNHGVGDLAEFFSALEMGRCLGAKCNKCGTVSFPPRPLCGADGQKTERVQLSGLGVLDYVTFGDTNTLLTTGGHSFGLVSLDGADVRVFTRLLGDPEFLLPGTRVKLSPQNGDFRHPIQRLAFAPV